MTHASTEIRRMRSNAGMTLTALADRLGMATSSLARYEAGNAEPRVSLMGRIHAACRVNHPALTPFIPIFDTEDRSGE